MKKLIFILLFYVFIFFIGADYLVSLLRLVIQNNNVLLSSLLNFLVYVVMLVACGLLFKKELKTDFVNFKDNQNKATEIVLGYLLLIGAGFVGMMLVALLGVEYRDSINQQSIEIIMKSKYIYFAASAVLIAAIVEEVVFRKALFSLLCDKWKFSPILVAVLSSILFGMIHVIDNINGDITELILVIPYITRGAALCYVYLRNDRNIAYPIAVHFLNNLISIFAIFIV